MTLSGADATRVCTTAATFLSASFQVLDKRLCSFLHIGKLLSGHIAASSRRNWQVLRLGAEQKIWLRK